MGLRPVSVYFGDTVNYAKGFYTAANSRDPFSWQWEGEWLFTTLCNGLPDTATSILFPAMCHCLYRFIVAGYATYLQRVLLYSFLSHTQHVYFLELRVNGIRNGMGASLFILAMTYVNRPPVMIGLCVLAAGIHKSIYLMVGAGTLTWFIKNSYWYLAGWMACVGVSYAIGGRIQAYLAATNLMGRRPLFRLSDR